MIKKNEKTTKYKKIIEKKKFCAEAGCQQPMGEVARQNKPAAGSALPHQPHPDMLHNVNTIANKDKALKTKKRQRRTYVLPISN